MQRETDDNQPNVAAAEVSSGFHGAAPLVGTTLGESYRVDRKIAEGGMGIIYAGEHLRLHRQVAIKVLKEPLNHNAEALARFKLEAEIIARLGHPNVVQVFDVGTTPQGTPYLVMEYLRGESLLERITKLGRIPLPSALRIAERLGSALAATHRAGVVHRDIKPENILLVEADGDADFVKLLDFGIGKVMASRSRITAPAVALGTPEYMAPEQALARATVDARADQYSLAAVSFAMLTGRPPFTGANPAEVLERVLREPAPLLSAVAPELPVGLDAVFSKALSKKAADRFGSVSEFVRAMERCVQSRRTPPARAAAPTEVSARDRAPSGFPSARAAPPSARPPGSERASPAGALPVTQRPPGGAAEHLEAARSAASAGRLDEAVEHAEALIELAAADRDPQALELLRTWLPLLDRIFSDRVGSFERRVRLSHVVGASGRARLSAAAEMFLEHAKGEPTVAELLRRSGAPSREGVRLLAGLLRRRLISTF